MADYYDRQGNPIAMMDWAKRLEDLKSKRVAETTLPDGTWISTVWLGLNHQFGDGPPLIFETMVFEPHSESQSLGAELDCHRYSTEAEAVAGHAAMVAKWSHPQLEPTA